MRQLVNAGLILGGLLAVSIACVVYAITPELSFGSRAVFIGTPAVIGLLFLLSCLLAFETKTRILLSAIGATLGLYMAVGLVEILFFWSKPLTSIERAALEAGRPYDPRSRFEAYVDLKRKDPNATLYVSPLYTVAWDQEALSYRPMIEIDGRGTLPLGGQSMRPTLYCNESGQYVIFDSDEHGFKNPRGIWNSGKIQAVILGDSFGNAACVEEENSHTHAIRAAYSKTLNLSAAGNGPLIMLAYMHEFVRHLKPDFILWMFFEGNDMENITVEKKVPLLLEYVKDRSFDQRLIGSQVEVDAALDRFVAGKLEGYAGSRNGALEKKLNLGGGEGERPLSRRIVDAALLRNLRWRLGLPNFYRDLWPWAKSPARDYATLRQILTQARGIASEWGGRLVFVYLPSWYRGRTPSTVNAYLQDIHENVRRIVGQDDIPFLDLTGVFARHPDPKGLVWYSGSHYSSTGYRVVGDEVVRFLRGLKEQGSM